MRAQVESGVHAYPIFIGYLPAKVILRIADAPSFSDDTDHSNIARNVLNPPIKDWQRPLDVERIGSISRFFNDTGEMMPNPVLLSENAFSGIRLEARHQKLAGGVETDIWIVSIPEPSGRKQKPLWILDGQHRIHGLAKSKQSNNKVPLVLLLNSGVPTYKPQTFAKLFAQVTTSATKLHALHDEWLTYAFQLSAYAPGDPSSKDHTFAMETVARLCEKQSLRNSIANPFFDSITFNPYRQPVPHPTGGGFEYTCQDLKDIVLQYYYAEVGPARPALTPGDLAVELGLAYVALQKVVKNEAKETVFFGDTPGRYGSKPIQDAFIIGVLTHIRHHGAPDDWVKVLKRLGFGDTDWRFHQWVETTGGAAGNVARKVARSVFQQMFRDDRSPDGVDDLADYLRGDAASVKMVASRLTPSGQPSRRDRVSLVIQSGRTITPKISGRNFLKLEATTPNVGQITVADASSPLAKKITAAVLRRGLKLEAPVPSPLQLLIRMEFFGGLNQETKVTIRWAD